VNSGREAGELGFPSFIKAPTVAAFIANLMDADVEFLACDQPFASRLTLHILAAVAEDEVRRISERTKAALQAAKARGRKLGSLIAPKRSRRMMSLVCGKNTEPERIVRSLVHRMGYRFCLHGSKLPGRPDIAFATAREVIFVHGCFWHRHEAIGCRLVRLRVHGDPPHMCGSGRSDDYGH
jgi:DNA mismatch endonuclease Vsr